MSSSTPLPWWRSAVIYQIYLRSFADGNGDGIGDIAGIRSRLPYLAGLGVDALWINPWYPSPMADAGYDVSDYRDVEPIFGTLDEAGELIGEAHERGLRVILDIVPNHTSDRHAWFQAALAAGRESAERGRYLFRDGRGPGGQEPPNDWRSTFGGSAWTRVEEPGGDPGQWYLHLFAPEQPDLDWSHPDVAADFERTLRFWFDCDVDGFRIDVAHSLVKAPGLPDIGDAPEWPTSADDDAEHPHWDRQEVHEVFRSWRRIADSYDPPRIFVAEAWVARPERLALYVRPDELHTAFNFEFLRSPWHPDALRRTIERTLSEHAQVGAPPTWVLSNHDVAREVSRYAREQPDRPVHMLQDLTGQSRDLSTGRRRARAAALLMLALPGGAYIYQGEELGLEEVEDLPQEVLQDPTWKRSGGTNCGRDGCRVPLPWAGERAPFGFSPPGAPVAPWLPQPGHWGDLSVAAQEAEATSMLHLYRAALALRRAESGLDDSSLRWLASAPGVLLFERSARFSCLVNLSPGPVDLPEPAEALLASSPLAGRSVPIDAAVWLRTGS